MCTGGRVSSFLTVLSFINVAAVSFNNMNENSDINHENALTIMNRTSTLDFTNVCEGRKCFAKCCPEGQIFNLDHSCESRNLSFNFSNIGGIYRNDCDFDNLTECKRNDISSYYDYFNVIIQGAPECFNKSRISVDVDEFKLFDTGSVIDLFEYSEYNVTSYCVELFDNGITTVGISLICTKNDGGDTLAASQEMNPNCIGMFISVVFLITTFLVYAILPDLRNLHGKSLMNHCAALGAAYFFLAVLQMDINGNISLKTCIVLSYVVIFAFLSSFFWLNVMCFDIWWVFSGYRPPSAHSKKEIERKKFIFYSIYSWGLAAVIFFIVFIMEMPWIPKHFVRPEFGEDKCWFKSKEAEFYYFYLPLAFILSSNLLFFVLTTYRILKISKETKVLTHGENKRHEEHERQRFVLYLKLFIVMGINWMTELISFFYPELQSVWYITDASNTLQGVLIFLIFVWKKRILRLLKMKFHKTFFSSNGLSKTGSKSSHIATQQTSISSTSDSYKMKTLPSIKTKI